jgi:hypothetical protein
LSTAVQLDSFTQQYLATALWSSTDENNFQRGVYMGGGEMLDATYAIIDFAEEATQQAVQDCQKFQQENAALLEQAYATGINPSTAGHDFWLTRNHHGAGFWDGDYPKEVGEQLTKASHAFKELNLYAQGGKVFFE